MIKLKNLLLEFAGKVHDLETLELKLIGMVKDRKLDHPEASNILTRAYEEAKTKGQKIAVQNALKDAQKGMSEDLSIEKKLSRYAGRYGGEPEKLVPDPGEQNETNPVVQSSPKGGSNKSKKRGKFGGTYTESKLTVEHIQYLAEGFMVRVARTRNRKLANQLVFMLRRNIGLRSLAGKDFKVRKIGAGKYGVYAMKPLVQQSREWLKKNAERLPQKYKVEQTSKSDKTPRGGQGYRTGQEYWASKRGDVQRAQSDVEKFQSKTRKPKPIRREAKKKKKKYPAKRAAQKRAYTMRDNPDAWLHQRAAERDRRLNPWKYEKNAGRRK